MTVRVIYQGADTGSTISGRPDGTFYYRLRAATPPATAAHDSAREPGPAHAGWRKSAWSATHAVTVAHHPLARAFAFLATGALVFLITAAMILLGTLRARKSKSGAVT